MENFDRASISPFNLFKPTEFSMNHEGNMPDYSQDYNYVNYYGKCFLLFSDSHLALSVL